MVIDPRRIPAALRQCTLHPLEIPIRNFWNSNSTSYDFSRGVIRIPMKYVCRRYTPRTQTIRINGRSFPWVFLARLIRSPFTPVNPRKEMRVPRAVRHAARFFSDAKLPSSMPLCQPLCESTCFNDQLTDRVAHAMLSTGFRTPVYSRIPRRSTSSRSSIWKRTHCDCIFPATFFPSARPTIRVD